MAAVESELATLVISPSRNELLEELGQFRGWLCIFLHTYPNAAVMATTRTAYMSSAYCASRTILGVTHTNELSILQPHPHFIKEKPDKLSKNQRPC